MTGWRWWHRVLAGAWIVGAMAVWNTVFDAHIVKGARDYVDRQQLFIDGRGPRVDVDRVMGEAKAAGVRAAWAWTGVELAPGLALAAVLGLRSRRRRDPGATPAASR